MTTPETTEKKKVYKLSAATKALKITQPYNGYEVRYPILREISDKQLEKQIWFASKIRVVEEDRMEMLYQLDEQQRTVVQRILPTFRKYEHDVANFWMDVYCKMFVSHECLEGAAVINMMERAVHERFYDKVNEVFQTNTDEHYLSYLDDPIFKERAKWLGQMLKHGDKKAVCLVFGLVEGVSLFSMFALLRSFQANGYNKIATTVKGTKQSAIDELLHSEFLAASFKYYYAELKSSLDEDPEYYNILLEQCHNVVAMEEFILTNVIKVKGFPEDRFNGVLLTDYFKLIKVLANIYFNRLGSKQLPFPELGLTCELYEWFITASTAYAETDFFGKGEGKEYEHAWNEDGFIKAWLKDENEGETK